MSPALDNRFKAYQRLFGNRQVARSLHFLVMWAPGSSHQTETNRRPILM